MSETIDHHIASGVEYRDVARSAIRKLSHGEFDPSKYTDSELFVLSFIAHDKFRRTDMSLVDVSTKDGLSRLSFALYNDKTEYGYYMNKLG